jgi:hypothetical protein
VAFGARTFCCAYTAREGSAIGDGALPSLLSAPIPTEPFRAMPTGSRWTACSAPGRFAFPVTSLGKDGENCPLQGGAKIAILKDDAKELMNMGATPKTAVLLAAASELIKRRTEEDVRTAETLSGAEEAYRFLKPRLADLPHEVFGVIFLNQDQAEQERRKRNATDQDQARVGDFLHGRPGAHHRTGLGGQGHRQEGHDLGQARRAVDRSHQGRRRNTARQAYTARWKGNPAHSSPAPRPQGSANAILSGTQPGPAARRAGVFLRGMPGLLKRRPGIHDTAARGAILAAAPRRRRYQGEGVGHSKQHKKARPAKRALVFGLFWGGRIVFGR